MKSHLSPKSEKLSYVTRAIGTFGSSLIGPMMLSVFVPEIARYGVAAANLVGAVINLLFQWGFARNAKRLNMFGRMLAFTRDHLVAVMVIDFSIYIMNIVALYWFPTVGYILFPMTGILDIFVDQIIKEDTNRIFSHDSDNGLFRTYFDNTRSQYSLAAGLLGSGLAFMITTMQQVTHGECVAALLIKSVIVFPFLAKRRNAINEDAKKMIEYDR